MSKGLRQLLGTLLNKKYIGGSHTPEDKMIKSKTRWIDDTKDFKKDYKRLIKEGIILRTKKRTKKGMDWHISINPRKLKEAYKIFNG